MCIEPFFCSAVTSLALADQHCLLLLLLGRISIIVTIDHLLAGSLYESVPLKQRMVNSLGGDQPRYSAGGTHLSHCCRRYQEEIRREWERADSRARGHAQPKHTWYTEENSALQTKQGLRPWKSNFFWEVQKKSGSYYSSPVTYIYVRAWYFKTADPGYKYTARSAA